MSELKACPFCGSSCVEISRYGNSKVSTFYQCNDCGVSLETSETFNHGEQWNNRPYENKLKADAVRKFSDALCHSLKYEAEGLRDIEAIEAFIDDFTAEKLGRGEL